MGKHSEATSRGGANHTTTATAASSSWGTGASGTSSNSSGSDHWDRTFVRDKVCILSLGVVGLSLMFALTCVFIGIEVGNYQQLLGEETSREPIPLLEALITSLQLETDLRINAVAAAYLESTSTTPARTDEEKLAALEGLQGARALVADDADRLMASLSDSESQTDASRLAETISAYHSNDPDVLPVATDATDVNTNNTNVPGRILSAHLRVVRYAVVAVLHHVQSKLPAAFYKSLQLYALSFQSAYHTGAAVDVAAVLTRSKLTTSFNMLMEVGYAATEARVLDSFAELAMEQQGLEMTTLSTRTRDEIVQQAIGVGGVVNPDAGQALIGEYNRGNIELTALIGTLRTRGFGVTPKKASKDSVAVIIVCVVYLAVVAVALLCVIYLYVRFVRSTRRARQLLQAYGDYTGDTRSQIATYRPVLSQIRTNVTLPHLDTIVLEQYHRAATFILQLRPYAPQALFGPLHDTHRLDPDGKWRIESQDARLEMGQGFGICTILTVAVSSPSIRRASRETVAGVMAEMTVALNIVSSIVNAAGGIVHVICPGGKIVCVWNATNFVEDVALVAVSSARIVDERLGEVGLDRGLNVATGQCVTSNCKVGTRKLVLLIGSPFESAERLSLLNEEHVANLVIDAETFKELPREYQRQCKPIALISDSNTNVHTIAMTADASEGLRGDQWKLYNTAFSLYQNNMVVEALAEFTKYLAIYPNDKSAQWLREHVLLGRAEAAKMRNLVKRGGGGGTGGVASPATVVGGVAVTKAKREEREIFGMGVAKSVNGGGEEGEDDVSTRLLGGMLTSDATDLFQSDSGVTAKGGGGEESRSSRNVVLGGGGGVNVSPQEDIFTPTEGGSSSHAFNSVNTPAELFFTSFNEPSGATSPRSTTTAASIPTTTTNSGGLHLHRQGSSFLTKAPTTPRNNTGR